MKINAQSPQSQNAANDGVLIRVTFDDVLPCLPVPSDVEGDANKGIANGIQPVINSSSESVVQPIAANTQIFTQAFGHGPNDGKTNKMRAVNIGAPTGGSTPTVNLPDQNYNSGKSQIIAPPAQPGPPPDPYKDMKFKGSHFPYDEIKDTKTVKGNKYVQGEIVPLLDKMSITKGMKGLIMCHAIKEGFRPGTRAYKHNNPGNVGNTDSGKNVTFPTLQDGINHLRDYILKVAAGNHRRYTLGKQVTIKPYFSKEVDRNRDKYKKSPYLPGYEFTYSGQIDQYVKIYATGTRSGNSYISLILSYFKGQLGIQLTPESKIQDIIKLN